MAQAETANEHSGPRSHRATWLTSWKLWLLLLFIGLLLIAVAVAIPAYRRLKAFEYISQHLGYEMEGDDEWITDRFGEWAMGMRKVRRISLRELSREAIHRVGIFSEVRELEAPMQILCGPHRDLTVDDVRPLTNLTHLTELDLGGPLFRDEVVAELLSGHPPLTSIRLFGTQAGHTTLRELSRIPSLEKLELSGAAFNDDDFRDLHALPHLQMAFIVDCSVGDGCIEWLAQSPELRMLHLRGGHITDWSLFQLAELQQLRTLTLYDCPDVTSAGIAHLASSPRLRLLGIRANLITDETIEFLRRCPNLETLAVDGTITNPELQQTVVDEWDLVNYAYR